jgi:hypothetical protein
MRTLRTRLVTIVTLLCFALVNAAPIAAAPGGNGNGNGSGGNNGNGGRGNGNGNGNSPPTLSATPELNSLALFGTSAAGMAGYALLRLRAARRQNDPD